MSFFSYALGALILVLVLLRQVRVRPVPRVFQPRLPIVIGVIGLFEMFSYAGNHHVPSSAWLWVLGTLVIGGIGLGVLRGLSMRVWTGNGWVLRQGNAVTMALWLVSLLVHFVGDNGQSHAGAAGLEGASFLLVPGRDAERAVLRRPPPCPAAVGPTRARRRPAVGGAIQHVHAVARRLLRQLHHAGGMGCGTGIIGRRRRRSGA